MKKHLIAWLAYLLLCNCALAQNGANVRQSGTVTPGHVPVWVSPGVIKDGGTAFQGFLTSLGVTAQGPGICQNSAAVTGPYNRLCLSVSTNSTATIELQNLGGAPAQQLNFVVNGVTYSLPPSMYVQIANTGFYGTRAGAIAASIVSTVNTVVLTGYAVNGDAPLAAYKRIPCATAVAWGFQSADKLDSNGATCTGSNINWLLNEPILFAQQFGAKCDGGATDDSTAFQNMINAGQSMFLETRFTGACKASFTITDRVAFRGVSIGDSVLFPQTAATNGININGQSAAILKDFQISYNIYGTATPGSAGIFVTSPSGENSGTIIDNVLIDNASFAFYFLKASTFTLSNSKTTNTTGSCVHIENQNVADSGDSTVDNLTCTLVNLAGAGIEYQSSSGLRLINSKFNGGMATGLYVNLPAGIILADLFVTANSFEGMSGSTSASIRFNRGAGAGIATGTISGNELHGRSCIVTSVDTAWILGFSVTGNACALTEAANSIAFQMDGIRGWTFDGNTVQNRTGGSNGQLFAFGANASECRVGDNTGWGGTFVADTLGACTGGLTVTKTVRAAGGAADCTLIFNEGRLTGGTC